jgi:2-polyprenyl-6-methoxyphenol hydroxylase-like FAD-dependent oxidoreductase
MTDDERINEEASAESEANRSPQLRTTIMVLIVGAGPTGLILACELARSGASFRLIEASRMPQPGSRGKGIQPRTLEVFDDLGVVDRVIANGRMSMPIRKTAPMAE